MTTLVNEQQKQRQVMCTKEQMIQFLRFLLVMTGAAHEAQRWASGRLLEDHYVRPANTNNSSYDSEVEGENVMDSNNDILLSSSTVMVMEITPTAPSASHFASNVESEHAAGSAASNNSTELVFATHMDGSDFSTSREIFEMSSTDLARIRLPSFQSFHIPPATNVLLEEKPFSYPHYLAPASHLHRQLAAAAPLAPHEVEVQVPFKELRIIKDPIVALELHSPD